MATSRETIQRTGEAGWRQETLTLLREVHERMAAIEHALERAQSPDAREHTITLTIDPEAEGTPIGRPVTLTGDAAG